MSVRMIPVGRGIAAACMILLGLLGGAGSVRAAGSAVPAAGAPAATVPAPAPAAAVPLTVRVRVGAEAASFRIGADAPFQITDLSGNAVLAAGNGGERVEVQIGPAGGIRVAGAAQELPGPVQIRLAGAGYVRAGNNPYRGTFEVRRYDARLALINVVALEDYLLGVVPKEMPASWPAEALKAQAVAARTYALYQLGQGKYQGLGYDLVDTVESQVYGGVAAEVKSTTQAVRDTAGRVLTYQGQPINALFHASSGGHTEDSRNVFGSSVPYLKGVPDFDQASPRYRWSVSFTLEELGQRLAGGPYDVGQLYRVVPFGPQGVSGRWTTLSLIGSTGQKTIKATEFRRLLGLYSTLFAVEERQSGTAFLPQPLPADRPLTVLGAGGRSSQAPPRNMVAVGGARPAAGQGVASSGMYLPVSAVKLDWVVLARQPVAAGLTLEGRGWGHGVGMSQWGAKGMAEQGNTYDQILRHYYQGTVIEGR